MNVLRNLKLDLLKLVARQDCSDAGRDMVGPNLDGELTRRTSAAIHELLEALENAPKIWDELLWELGYEFPKGEDFELPTCAEYHGEECGCNVGLTAKDKDWWRKANATYPRFVPEYEDEEWETTE